jgi:hypothetical protein
MRKWGIVIGVFYAVILLLIVVPATPFLAGGAPPSSTGYFGNLQEIYSEWLAWIPVGAVLAGEAILLFLSVDTSFKRMKPTTHIAVSCAVGSMLFALLALCIVYAIGSAAKGDKFGEGALNTVVGAIGLWLLLWVVWGVVFFLYLRNSSGATTRVVAWLLKGSVLELLIAVPCHVIVRKRGDCCAPALTSFGIVTGVAVMLLSFGPSVLLLYKKRLDRYAPDTKASESVKS